MQRLRLYRLLDRALETPLTLVCAPAGFGKTTLVSAWIDSLHGKGDDGADLRCAWLSLDALDNDLAVFVQNWIAALRTLFPDAGSETLEMLRTAVHVSPAQIAVTLGNEIANLPDHFIMVLDDFTAIREAGVHELFDALLAHWPRTMHMVITLRRDAPWRLVDLRAKGKVGEIRTADLRFTKEETRQYLAIRLAGPIDDQVIERFDESLEGWIAGMHLATLYLRDGSGAQADLTTRLLNQPQMTSYLFEEILTQLPDDIQSFLHRTAIVERFDTSLAAALAGDVVDRESRDCIEWIGRHGLFISPLDTEGEWYRYHGIFRDFLRKRLATHFTSDYALLLHKRAAAWYAERGHLDEALQHATAADDLALAATLIEARLGDLLNQVGPSRLRRWLTFIPDAHLAHRPGLLVARAWVNAFKWQFGQQAATLDQIERLLQEEHRSPGHAADPEYERTLRGQVSAMRSQIAFFAGQYAESARLSREGLTLLPQSWTLARGSAALFHYPARWFESGDDEVAAELVREYESCPNQSGTYARYLLLAWCFIEAHAGRLERLLEAADALLHQATSANSALMVNWAWYFQGITSYARNELEVAEVRFKSITDQQFSGSTAGLHDSVAGLALVYQAQGRSAQAHETLRFLSDLDRDRLGHEDRRTQSLRARLHLLQGNVTVAGHWADSYTDAVSSGPLLWLETPHLTRARILIERGRKSDLGAALALLDRLSEVARQAHNSRHQIEIQATRALALAHVGRIEESLSALHLAVELAHAGGHIRPFVDLGPRMRALLLRYPRQESSAEKVRIILNAFPVVDRRADVHSPRAAYHAMSSLGEHGLAEPLSARELEVLDLLRKGMTDKEIAGTMFIAISTVKRHTATIYGKLGVHNRADAVVLAEALGLLTPVRPG